MPSTLFHLIDQRIGASKGGLRFVVPSRLHAHRSETEGSCQAQQFSWIHVRAAMLVLLFVA
jgi:hypothetical protein